MNEEEVRTGKKVSKFKKQTLYNKLFETMKAEAEESMIRKMAYYTPVYKHKKEEPNTKDFRPLHDKVEAFLVVADAFLREHSKGSPLKNIMYLWAHHNFNGDYLYDKMEKTVYVEGSMLTPEQLSTLLMSDLGGDVVKQLFKDPIPGPSEATAHYGGIIQNIVHDVWCRPGSISVFTFQNFINDELRTGNFENSMVGLGLCELVKKFCLFVERVDPDGAFYDRNVLEYLSKFYPVHVKDKNNKVVGSMGVRLTEDMLHEAIEMAEYVQRTSD